MVGVVHGKGACMAVGMDGGGTGGMHSRWVCMVGEGGVRGGLHGRGAYVARDMATSAGGTHPTGMHSC